MFISINNADLNLSVISLCCPSVLILRCGLNFLVQLKHMWKDRQMFFQYFLTILVFCFNIYWSVIAYKQRSVYTYLVYSLCSIQLNDFHKWILKWPTLRWRDRPLTESQFDVIPVCAGISGNFHQRTHFPYEPGCFLGRSLKTIAWEPIAAHCQWPQIW